MFLDADDMLMPRAAEVLYREAKLQNYDLIQSGFYRENDDKDTVIQPSGTTITWFHGKIYRTQFLKEKNISFLPGLRVDEDAYFNAVAWNSTESRGQIEEALYLWRNNKNSITRELDDKTYFCQNYFNYIHSQTSALMRIFEINNKMPEYFTANTLMNIYYYYMRAKFYQLNEIIMIEDISRLKAQPWIKNFFNDFNMWQHIINNIKSGQIYDKGNVVFFSETFDKWVNRLLLRS